LEKLIRPGAGRITAGRIPTRGGPGINPPGPASGAGVSACGGLSAAGVSGKRAGASGAGASVHIGGASCRIGAAGIAVGGTSTRGTTASCSATGVSAGRSNMIVVAGCHGASSSGNTGAGGAGA